MLVSLEAGADMMPRSSYSETVSALSSFSFSHQKKNRLERWDRRELSTLNGLCIQEERLAIKSWYIDLESAVLYTNLNTSAEINL